MPPELNFQSTLASEKLVRSVVPKVPPVRGKSSFLAEGVASLELHNRAISPLFGNFSSYSVVKYPFMRFCMTCWSQGPPRTQRASARIVPCPVGHSSRCKIQPPALLRSATPVVCSCHEPLPSDHHCNTK